MLFHSDVSLPVMGWFHRYYDRLFKEQLVPMMPEMAVQMYRKKWGWVKTLVPSEPQNSWDLWMFIPLKMYL